MKCPHCGMNIRDDTTECGYCGGKVGRGAEKASAGAGRFAASRGGAVQKEAQRAQKPSDEPETDEEEGGGLSAILQPGEQVLIGSLNVAVKKFSFHAYLTNQRIFLIDTQEKKLKVTAKDVARDTIVGSIVEFSENSDPVLVLSIKSGDDETKTMKLVFVQSGTDRASEIDEWIALLQEAEAPKKSSRKPAPAHEQEESGEPEDEESAPIRVPEKPRQRQELQPAKRPLKKDHERQPPVKRLVPYKIPEEESEPEPEPEQEPEPEIITPPRRAQVRQVVASSYDREIPPAYESDVPPVRKPEVQTAMRVAMKGALKQTSPSQQPIRRAVVESPRRPVQEPEPEPEVEFPPSRRPVVQENIPEAPVAHAEVADSPQFCHNCGKKLPHSANFCPGCGTKLSMGRTLPHSRTSPTLTGRKATRTDPPGHEHRPVPQDAEDEEAEGEKPVPTRPPVKKAPKGSEMTILHKFLRR
ncbi:zinc-ribbon domain-containing protein [Methanoregula sp.]|uniref:zinc ribbon domain-containing protein n=1 Tax=Methanoregula sp. TaxID=2052170 RepID=UPI00237247D0|nr:zinc-ribbon domain-containing protein [Methanoregula sp.]MDD1685722.1 zinc-ribbon domain-containing protein [Methanoregula sp.]